MKYVIMQPVEGGLPFVISTLPPQTHARLVAPYAGTAVPVSAGFMEFYELQADGSAKVRTFGYSTSLNLGPGRHDAAMLEGFYNACIALEKKGAAA